MEAVTRALELLRAAGYNAEKDPDQFGRVVVKDPVRVSNHRYGSLTVVKPVSIGTDEVIRFIEDRS